MMQHQLDDIVERGIEPVALLWASESSIYGRFGYGPALGAAPDVRTDRQSELRPGVDLGGGSVGEVDRDKALPIIADLRRGWLAERVGALDRSEAWWAVRWHDPEAWRHGASALPVRAALRRSGRPDGYTAFRVKESGPQAGAEVQIAELDGGDSGRVRRALPVRPRSRPGPRFTKDGPVDDPLHHLVEDFRRIKTECTAARTSGSSTSGPPSRRGPTRPSWTWCIGVRDPMLPNNDGAIQLQAGPDGATTSKSRRKPDLSLDVRDLGGDLSRQRRPRWTGRRRTRPGADPRDGGGGHGRFQCRPSPLLRGLLLSTGPGGIASRRWDRWAGSRVTRPQDRNRTRGNQRRNRA